MDEIVKQVHERTGLPEDKAKQATEVVIELLKKRLPAPIAGQIDSVIGGQGGGLGNLGGMLGR